jgi:transposase
MQVVYERSTAIDVHQKTAVTTVLITQTNGHVQKETRTFSTMTSELLRLDDWLQEQEVDVVAMESTGVFWHPIFNLLEEGREIILVNAQHIVDFHKYLAYCH